MADHDVTWASLLEAVDDLMVRTANGDDDEQRMNVRLRDSVERPLRGSAGGDQGEAAADAESSSRSGGVGTRSDQPLVDRLWGVARIATALRVKLPESAALAEGVAALQDLAVVSADESSASGRLAEWPCKPS